jgi:hypothetical protein
MENDGFSGKGHSAEYPAKLPQAAPSNLTQELAQLLAASIAQNQANRVLASGVPTNSELTSLAHLVSAASGHRTLAPVFKDGLSALSYSRPHGRPPHEAPQQELAADDEPMPIPSTWREPIPSDDQRWYRQQMGAAFLGLVAGLMIVVPSVLWLSGRIGPLKAAPMPEHQLAMAGEPAAEIKTPKVQVRPLEKREERAVQY